jgi:hypothetical protein
MHAGASRVPDLDERQQHAKARVGSSPGRYIIALVCRRFPVAELRWIFAPGGCGDLLPIPEGTPCSRRTSVAGAYIAALGALVLAHGADFQQEFAPRNARKVERLFQILKGTVQTVGDPVECGAGSSRRNTRAWASTAGGGARPAHLRAERCAQRTAVCRFAECGWVSRDRPRTTAWPGCHNTRTSKSRPALDRCAAPYQR